MYQKIIEELDLVILFCFVKLGMGRYGIEMATGASH